MHQGENKIRREGKERGSKFQCEGGGANTERPFFYVISGTFDVFKL